MYGREKSSRVNARGKAYTELQLEHDTKDA